MHEAGLAQNLLDLALETLQRNGNGRVSDLYLEMGRMAGVVPEALEFAFEVVARGSAVEGARLHFRFLEVRFACGNCATEIDEELRPAVCPRCGGSQVVLRQGREFRLTEMEVDDHV
jgi:hydrogenase nickel incorporation protein HypA/HybF